MTRRNSQLNTPALDRLETLAQLLDEEERVVRERTEAVLKGATAKELEKAGVLLRKARVVELRPALFGRARLTLGDDRDGQIDRFDVRPGAVVAFMERDAQGGEGGLHRAASGVVVRKSRGRLDVVLDSSEGAADVQEAVDLLRVEDEVTLRRLREGLDACRRVEGRQARLVEMVLGAAPPRATRIASGPPEDTTGSTAENAPRATVTDRLNADQRAAARHGELAEDVALVHGPPGTGKTHVLVEIIRRCVARGERVLAACASNAAVDHLAATLLDAPRPEGAPATPLVRLGNPARAAPALEAHTLAALTDAHEHRRLARDLVDQAFALLRTARRRSSRGGDAYKQEREVRAEAGRLFADARRLERQAVADVFSRARVVCATLTGLHDDVLGDEIFDTLVVDEASQALTPALLLAVLRAKRVVLAGDHRQLPPTVLSDKAARQGLADTAFRALIDLDPAGGFSTMLTVQHRMHEALMAFPSERFYGGKLVAHADVGARTLFDAIPSAEPDAADDLVLPTRPLDVIDTAGTGHEERRGEAGESRDNPGEVEIVARVVRGVIDRGVPPAELGVITPYAAQVGLLAATLVDLVDRGLEIDSVDGFQGREKDVIVFSGVRSNADGAVGFLADPRRLNVAITRARRKLVIVGDSAMLSTDETWRALFDHAIAAGAYRSAFELP
jgi:hypothetical protein